MRRSQAADSRTRSSARKPTRSGTNRAGSRKKMEPQAKPAFKIPAKSSVKPVGNSGQKRTTSGFWKSSPGQKREWIAHNPKPTGRKRKAEKPEEEPESKRKAETPEEEPESKRKTETPEEETASKRKGKEPEDLPTADPAQTDRKDQGLLKEIEALKQMNQGLLEKNEALKQINQGLQKQIAQLSTATSIPLMPVNVVGLKGWDEEGGKKLYKLEPNAWAKVKLGFKDFKYRRLFDDSFNVCEYFRYLYQMHAWLNGRDHDLKDLKEYFGAEDVLRMTTEQLKGRVWQGGEESTFAALTTFLKEKPWDRYILEKVSSAAEYYGPVSQALDKFLDTVRANLVRTGKGSQELNALHDVRNHAPRRRKVNNPTNVDINALTGIDPDEFEHTAGDSAFEDTAGASAFEDTAGASAFEDTAGASAFKDTAGDSAGPLLPPVDESILVAIPTSPPSHTAVRDGKTAGKTADKTADKTEFRIDSDDEELPAGETAGNTAGETADKTADKTEFRIDSDDEELPAGETAVRDANRFVIDSDSDSD